jgi:hypothetical protein
MEPGSLGRRPNAVRWVIRVAAPTVIVGLLVACSSGTQGPKSTGLSLGTTPKAALWKTQPAVTVTSTFPRFGLSFRHPATWRVSSYNNWSSFRFSIAYLGTEALHDPCTRTRTSTGMEINCAEPLNHIRAGGVLISWSSIGMPGGRLVNEPGIAEIVGGHPARIVVGPAAGGCADLGGDTSIEVRIQQLVMSSHDQTLQMDACLRGPGVAANQAAVQRMLDSLRLTSQ